MGSIIGEERILVEDGYCFLEMVIIEVRSFIILIIVIVDVVINYVGNRNL